MRPVAGALALVAALAVTALAVDVRRVHGALEADDATYAFAPERPRYDQNGFLPGSPATHVLGIRDDLAYRRALHALAALYAGERASAGRDFAVLVTQAQRGLVEVSQTDPDPRRRSEATNLFGVFTVANLGGYSGFNPDFNLEAARIFENAVRIDPTNQVAKRNLEITWRGLRRTLLPIPPEGQRGAPNQGAGAGIGRAGGGY